MSFPAGKTPLVDTSQAEGFNMGVLKRMDEDIIEILYSATHVAVYEFDTARKSWRRSDIEGTLFLVKRCSAPRFRMIVVNSKRIDNFTEEVNGSLECEVLQTFLLYTKGNNQLYGIWFFDEKNCEEFGNYLKRIVKGMPKASPVGTPTKRDKTMANMEQKNTDLRNELQTILHQLNGHCAQPSGVGSSSQKTTGESDHLMRLLMQANNKRTNITAPAVVSAPPAMLELPSSDILSLDPVPMIHTFNDLGTTAALSSVPLVPLPPDFFKPSSKPTIAVSMPTAIDNQLSSAPDPMNLPILLPDTIHMHSKDTLLPISVGFETNGMASDGENIASSLARFFGKSENEEQGLESTRDKVRQVLINVLSNDVVMDLLIEEFKKVGISFQ